MARLGAFKFAWALILLASKEVARANLSLFYTLAIDMENIKTFPTNINIVRAEDTLLAPATDYELTQRASEGDMEAFELIYQKYNRRVFSLCLRVTQNVSTSEDLAQEVFIQLFKRIGSFRGESAFTTWLHRLTLNHVLMHFRKGHIRRESTPDDGDMPVEAVRGTENPERMALVDRIELDNAIAQLPPGYRAVFILHDVEGHEHHEIGRILDCSVGTSKSQLHKARMKLRRLLLSKKPEKYL